MSCEYTYPTSEDGVYQYESETIRSVEALQVDEEFWVVVFIQICRYLCNTLILYKDILFPLNKRRKSMPPNASLKIVQHAMLQVLS
jgi:hypothetical protein